MTPSRQITIEEAKALASSWEDQSEQFADDAALASRFRNASPSAVISMWETGTNEDGKKLTRFEVRALVERWCEVFGCLPPCDGVESRQSAATSEPEPADTTMLDMTEVMRLTGLSKSTIKRRVQDGSFPQPMRTSIRRVGWKAGDVKAWLDQLGANRR